MELVSLIPSFGGLVWTVVAFVVALSVIVAVHEYGHYIVGRWSGIHAEVFSLGFGPVIWSRMDRRGTRWQIALLPFGGFVKFLGDSDAASGKDAAGMAGLTEAERRHTMHGAPLWARSATVAAGPVFNFILAILIFTGFVLWQGVATDEPIVGSVKAVPGDAQPLLPGDRILSLGGTETPSIETFHTVAEALAPAPTVAYTLLRDGQTTTIDGPFPFPPRADFVHPGSPAMEAGLQAGDVVQSVDGRPIAAISELQDLVQLSDGGALLLKVWRADTTFEVAIAPRRQDVPVGAGAFETRWLFGLNSGLVFEPQTRTPGPLEAVSLGAQRTWYLTKTNLSGVWHMIAGKISSCNLSGPIGIAEVAGSAASQGWEAFLHVIALLSLGIGIMNLFPVPVLDGGHLVFHAWEAVTGRPPSDRALQVLMTGGLAALLSLMVFALSNDLFCP